MITMLHMPYDIVLKNKYNFNNNIKVHLFTIRIPCNKNILYNENLFI